MTCSQCDDFEPQPVVINRCYGGFGLSDEAHELLGHEPDSSGYYYPAACDLDRSDPELIRVVRLLGSEKAGDGYSRLEVVEIPGDVRWEIEEHAGLERVREVSRSWPPIA